MAWLQGGINLLVCCFKMSVEDAKKHDEGISETETHRHSEKSQIYHGLIV